MTLIKNITFFKKNQQLTDRLTSTPPSAVVVNDRLASINQNAVMKENGRSERGYQMKLKSTITKMLMQPVMVVALDRLVNLSVLPTELSQNMMSQNDTFRIIQVSTTYRMLLQI